MASSLKLIVVAVVMERRTTRALTRFVKYEARILKDFPFDGDLWCRGLQVLLR